MSAVPSHVRIVTPEPVPNLTKRWGEAVHTARTRVAALEQSLKELVDLTEQLGGHGLTIASDLGTIGNSAMAAFKTMGEHDAAHPKTFALPRA
jgi:hypothetical protein